MTNQSLLAEVHNQQHTLTATVEQDGRTVYFYIWPADLFRSQYAVRGCWVRNLLPAPAEEDRDALEQGIPPLLSAEFCRTLEAEPVLDPAGLQILWDPADDGASLWYYGQLLATIPGWSLYQHRQVSFSAGCIKENPLTAPLGSASTNTHYAQAEQHRQFWRTWHDGQQWQQVEQRLLQCYQQQFGEPIHYYAIDQGRWPPMAISQHWHRGCWFFLTLGMSIRPMPKVDYLFSEQPSVPRRIELALAVDGEIMSAEHAVQMASALAEFAHLPWSQLDWLGEGHILSSEVTPVGFDSFLLSHQLAEGGIAFQLPKDDEEKPALLWATPVTSEERLLAQQSSTGSQQLIARLLAAGNSHIFRPRASVTESETSR